jgi:hypothetical protein
MKIKIKEINKIHVNIVNAYKRFVGQPEGKRHLWRHTYEYKDNIK